MAQTQLKQEIKQMIVERLFLNIDAADIADEDNLMEVHNIDSVNLFEIVVGLEDEFDISLENADFNIETFSTVESIAEYVENKRS
ncbi:MAG: acyl carrier protein [Armatimonadota bacterium]